MIRVRVGVCVNGSLTDSVALFAAIIDRMELLSRQLNRSKRGKKQRIRNRRARNRKMQKLKLPTARAKLQMSASAPEFKKLE